MIAGRVRSIAAYYAAWAAGGRLPISPRMVPAAKVYCSDAFFNCASENDPDSRRHRIHVGARRAAVFQASASSAAILFALPTIAAHAS